MSKIISLIPTDIINRWDGARYEIYAPVTLGDEATLVAHLFNKNGSRILVAFDFHEGVEIKQRWV